MSSRESSPTVPDSPNLASTEDELPVMTAPEPPPREPRGQRVLRYLKYGALAAFGLAVA